MEKNIENKEKFTKIVEKECTELEALFQSIKKSVNPHDASTQLDIKNKFLKLQECLSSLSWRIENFKTSPLQFDNMVKNSFDDLKAEIKWRIKEVQKSTGGKSRF
jgi:SMC interacting uncharacterized protein involved in chromosome segregation